MKVLFFVLSGLSLANGHVGLCLLFGLLCFFSAVANSELKRILAILKDAGVEVVE